jgi:hypothetical protein
MDERECERRGEYLRMWYGPGERRELMVVDRR